MRSDHVIQECLTALRAERDTIDKAITQLEELAAEKPAAVTTAPKPTRPTRSRGAAHTRVTVPGQRRRVRAVPDGAFVCEACDNRYKTAEDLGIHKTNTHFGRTSGRSSTLALGASHEHHA